MNKTDKEVLIEIKKDMEWLKTGFTNHLNHHWKITCIALTAAAIGSANLIVGVILALLRK